MTINNDTPNTASDEGDEADEGDLISLSAEYSAQLSLGGNPDFADWLQRVSPDRQESLVRRLKSVAAAFSLETPDDVGQLNDSTERPSARQSTDRVSITIAGEEEAKVLPQHRNALVLGEYILESELGRGGMGIVYRARNRETGSEVALKILPSVDGESLHRFKREFRSLADISHPNLIGLRSLENDGDQWFFTMDLVNQSRSFSRFVRPNNVLHEGRLKSALLQLCEGIYRLHSLEIVHRDLKPSNVVVDDAGRLVILDFGLVSELKRNDQTLERHTVSGTPAYMSPEAAAGEQEGFAADWYSVGVMIYAALSGKLPFDGEPMQMLADKRSRPAPEMEGNTTCTALKQLCYRLLDRSPERRPRYAEIIEMLGGDSIRSPKKKSETEHLLGREWQLSALFNCYAAVAHKERPSVAFVRGKSGEGKSALVREFLRQLKESKDITVLSGRCYDRESVPFKALDSLVDALASFLRTLDPIETAVLLPDDTHILAKVFPVLTRVEMISQRPSANTDALDETQIRRRAFSAFKELLRRLSARTSLVLFSDDLQWGDADSARVLLELLSGENTPKLLLIGSYRIDESETSPFLQQWNTAFSTLVDRAEVTDIDVCPLGEKECRELIDARFPKLSTRRRNDLAKGILEESSGNAFFVGEILDCIQVEDNFINRIPMAQVLTQKLRDLPSDAPDILNLIAVNGQAMPTQELLDAIGSHSSGSSALIALRNQRVIRFIDDDANGRIDTYHDKIRETVLNALGATGSAKLHHTLAKVIEERSSDLQHDVIARILAGESVEHPDVARIYDLSFHYHFTNDSEKAFVYSLMAAEQAQRQFAPEVAAERFRMAEQHLNGPETDLRFRCALGLGQALNLRGMYSECDSVLKPALSLTENPIEKANVELVLAEVSFKCARFQESKTLCISGLKRLGETVPATGFTFGVALASETLIQAVHTLFPQRLGRSPATEESQLLARLLVRLTYVNSFTSIPMMAWSIIRAMNHGERYTPDASLAFAYSTHSAIASLVLGWQSRADEYMNRAISLNQQAGNQWGIAIAHSWRGIGCYGTAKYHEGIEHLELAHQSFLKFGNAWEAHFARFHIGMCYFALGDIRSATETLQDNFRSSLRCGDTRAMCSSYGLSRALEDKLPFTEIASLVPPVPDDILSTINYLKAEGYWQLTNGDTQAAVDTLDRALKLMLRHKIIMTHTIAMLPLLVRALRVRYQELSESSPREASKFLRRAKRLGRRTSWIALRFPVDRAAALREYGLVCEVSGKGAKAIKLLEKSCKVAERQHERLELAHSRHELARIKLDTGRGSSEEVERTQLELAEFIGQMQALEIPTFLE